MARVRIGLNAHLFSQRASYRSAGVSRYIHQLLGALPQAGPTVEWVALVSSKAPVLPAPWEVRRSPWGTAHPAARILWEQVAQPWQASRARLNLLHEPVYVSPLWSPCPTIVTVHDLTMFLYAETMPRGRRLYLQTQTRRSVHGAAHVIADSEATRRDVIRLLEIAPERVTAVPLGVGAHLRPVEDAAALAAFRARQGLERPYLICVGTLEPRKNLPILLEAFAQLRAQPGFHHQLVLAGGKGWGLEAIESRLDALGLRGEVLLPGFVPEDELPLWYSAADVCVYPSIYEGFGLPPLEAMACGTPVIASNASSLPEAVGEAGVLVEPHDPAAWVRAISALLGDPAKQAELRAAGLARARAFTWEAMALQTVAVYRRVLGERHV